MKEMVLRGEAGMGGTGRGGAAVAGSRSAGPGSRLAPDSSLIASVKAVKD